MAVYQPTLLVKASLLLLFTTFHHSFVYCEYLALFSFGDSQSDTGNRAIAPDHTPSFCNKPPYGMTYFGYPAGRCSDGRLIIDFMAQAMGLPLLPPFLGGWKGGADFRKGVNFAVAAATAMDNSFFVEKGLDTYTNSSLGSQVEWFKSLLPSLCPEEDGKCELINKSLFMVGEIGGADLNYLFFANKSVNEIKEMFHMIVSTISSSIQNLINLGARTLLVPGNFPLGCSTKYIEMFSTSLKKHDFNSEIGCIIWLNRLIMSYNKMLIKELARLQTKNHGIAIIYVDYYNLAMRFYHAPTQFGLNDTLDACCTNSNVPTEKIPACSYRGASVCADPSTYVNWDGIHFTEAAYKAISDGIINAVLRSPILRNTYQKTTTSDKDNTIGYH